MGTSEGVPAFRWYDRELGRVLVANRPEDAAIIESRASTGLGLLADDGISISNLFTGDAPRAAMTMSRLEVSRGTRRTRRVFARFMVRPDGLFRSISRTIAEIARERFQAVHQRRLGVVPRVHRSWTFAGLRAFSNGLLRDLNTAIVAEEMMRGTRSIYVDYVDYDEVAHHAGATRIESLSALGGLDHVLSVLEKVAARAPRRYHVVALSDHGQSQGDPFASRYGIELSELCRAADRVADHRGGEQRRGLGPRRLGAGGPLRRRGFGDVAGGRQAGGQPDEAGDPRDRVGADRARQREPRAGLRARAAPAHPRRDRRQVAGPRPGSRGAPGHRLRRRHGRGRTGGDRSVPVATTCPPA